MMEKKSVYLGDSVYAEFDGYNVWIYLDNGSGPFSRIALEPAVFAALQEFIDDLKPESEGEQNG